MEIYFVLLTLVFILKPLPMKYYFVIISALLGLVAAFRGEYVGTDTQMYNGIYQGVNAAIFQWSYYDVTLTEIGNRFLMVFAKELFDMSQGYIIISSLLTFFFFGLFMYKVCDQRNYWIIPFAFVSLTYYAFSLNGLRQVLALSIAIFFYYFLRKKSYVKATAVILISALFHLSTLLFLAILPVVWIAEKWRSKLGNPSAFFLIMSSIELLAVYLAYRAFLASTGLFGEKYALYAMNEFSDASEPGISIIVIGAGALAFIVMKMAGTQEEKKDSFLLGLLVMQFVLFSIATSLWMAIIYRIAILFYPFLFILIQRFFIYCRNPIYRLACMVLFLIFGFFNLYYHMPKDVVPYEMFF